MPRIEIRLPEADDAPILAEAVQESLSDLQPWLGWATPAYSESDARSWIDEQVVARAGRTAFDLVVIEGGSRLVGACGVNQVNPVHHFANLGYWIRSSAAGRGVAVQAVRQLREWVHVNTDLQRLEIVIARGNHRSERVAEKAGAVREGILRSRLLLRGEYHDATMFSLIRGVV